jgi:hypothetical protein
VPVVATGQRQPHHAAGHDHRRCDGDRPLHRLLERDPSSSRSWIVRLRRYSMTDAHRGTLTPMGYQKSPADPDRPPSIELRSISRLDFELMTPFAYKPVVGEVVEVPVHPNDCAASTDLASVPPLLWGLLPSYGRQLRAALLHDRLCDLVSKQLRDGADRATAYRDRRRADDLFFEAMRDRGDRTPADLAKRVGWFRAKLFWIGVSYGRYWKLRKPLAALVTVHVLAGVLALDLLAGLAPLPWAADLLPWDWLHDDGVLALIWVAAVGCCVGWWRDWQVPVIGLLVGPLVLPVLLVTFVAQLVLGLPDQLLHAVRPEQQPPANFGPTATLARQQAPSVPPV